MLLKLNNFVTSKIVGYQMLQKATKCTAVANIPNKRAHPHNKTQPLSLWQASVKHQLALFTFLRNQLLSYFTEKPMIGLPLLNKKNETDLLAVKVPKAHFNSVMYSEKSGMIVTVDIEGFNARDVKVRVEEGFLVVEAQVENKHPDGGIYYKQMIKQYEIPPFYNISGIIVKAIGNKLTITIPPARPIDT
ncbi:uncharacterized protein isoform X2 [Rhodnius prolixus]|uniref:uncharacterized protein isoform X2 n=1 Tax=Rhodnius prolixus TaxID=13249 RepID=UPI003D18CDDD